YHCIRNIILKGDYPIELDLPLPSRETLKVNINWDLSPELYRFELQQDAVNYTISYNWGNDDVNDSPGIPEALMEAFTEAVASNNTVRLVSPSAFRFIGLRNE